jgi:hypothetical protein
LQGCFFPSLEHSELIAAQAAIAWEAGGELSVEDVEVAPPKAHEVRIRILWTGVSSIAQIFGRYLTVNRSATPMRIPFLERIPRVRSLSFVDMRAVELSSLWAMVSPMSRLATTSFLSTLPNAESASSARFL